jgi:ribosomal protein L7Ae-like RNA K-turn-binding protein
MCIHYTPNILLEAILRSSEKRLVVVAEEISSFVFLKVKCEGTKTRIKSFHWENKLSNPNTVEFY